MRTALAPAALVAALLAAAHPAPGWAAVKDLGPDPAATDAPRPDARVLADQFLDKIGADTMMVKMLEASRGAVITVLQRSGQSEDKAGEIFDSFMAPEFKARLPELRQRFVDILVQDFTADELASVLADRHDAARQSAIRKAGQLQGQFAAAGQQWGQQVGLDVYARNKATFQKLGLAGPGGDTQ